MTLRTFGVVFVGMSLAGVTCSVVAAQVVPSAQARQKVATQIILADQQEDEFAKGAVLPGAAGLVPPRATKQTNPKYTAAALRAKIAGDVKVEAIVGVDGRVEKSRIKESLDPDLDAEALRALNQWEFEPGRVNGQPARVLVEVLLTFRVH